MSQSITKSERKLSEWEDVRKLDRLAIPLINSGVGVDEAYRQAADQLERVVEKCSQRP